jgi:hypothetical protein
MAGIARDAQAGRAVGYACFPGREAGPAPRPGRTIALLHWFCRLRIRSLVLEPVALP